MLMVTMKNENHTAVSHANPNKMKSLMQNEKNLIYVQ